MIKNIFAIHGAWSSSLSFTHLESRVRGNWQMFSYDHSKENIDQIIERANNEITESSIVIGHSLGGIVALNMDSNPLVRGIITLASPLAGLEMNLLQIYLSQSNLLGQISSDSKIIRQTKQHEYVKPVIHVIASKGYNPFIFERNDGVLPYKIQTGWTCGLKVEADANHYEILQSFQTIDHINRFRRQLAS
jgi:pimeloyl-ACP methyl ester carboxylesterase